MSEKLDIIFPKDNFEGLINGKTTIEDFLIDEFTKASNHAVMCNALKEYHRNDGGSPEVHDFEIVNTKFDTNKLTGRFRTSFKINYHYTCSDVHNTAKDTIDWDFVVDSTNNIIHLTGEEPLVRDGDE
jgi:hypothetical protein